MDLLSKRPGGRSGLRRTVAALCAGVLSASLLMTASAAPALADPGDIPCDDQWHFAQVGAPIQERVEAGRFTFDNRKSKSPKKYTERVKKTTTSSYTHSVDVGIEITAGFSIFSASMSATLRAGYGFSITQENSVERETEVAYEVGPYEGYIVYIGIETMRVTGYYERILGCDTATQRYQRIGPVTSTVPGTGKVIWSEDLPALEAA
ncbi:hypothetical protein ABZ714_27765 [Streptomyces sp. NPDC006798]|uniref:hypothetical protein n=1 Tax=Streptomyces sp. NPDC006798 TaxID=3155462 RepID=UPI0033DB979D